MSDPRITQIREEYEKRCAFQNPDGTKGECDCFECRSIPFLLDEIERLRQALADIQAFPVNSHSIAQKALSPKSE
jgi:hypothetical protein